MLGLTLIAAVAVGVGVGCVGVLADVVEPLAESARLVAGGAGGVDKGLEKLKRAIVHVRRLGGRVGALFKGNLVLKIHF